VSRFNFLIVAFVFCFALLVWTVADAKVATRTNLACESTSALSVAITEFQARGEFGKRTMGLMATGICTLIQPGDRFEVLASEGVFDLVALDDLDGILYIFRLSP